MNNLSSGERRALLVLAVAFTAGVILTPVLAVTSLSPFANVLLGLSPFFITVLLGMVIVSRHFKGAVLFVTLFLVHLAALGWLHLGNQLLQSTLHVQQVTAVSFGLSALVVLLAWFADLQPVARKTERIEFKREKLPEVVQSIEDKCKAINFAIGRVYRSSNGGSAKLRERLRIPREWYNEFSDAQEDEREGRAVSLTRKILSRLLQYAHKENEIFSTEEMKRLKNLTRDREGNSTVLDVLAANDSDPVQQYYAVAVDACQQVLTELDES